MSGNSSPQQLADWDVCDAGELRQVVWHMKAARRNQKIIMAGGLTVVLLLSVFASTLIWQQFNASEHFEYGGISCQKVRQRMADYSRGQLEPKLANQIRVHLSKCPNCRPIGQTVVRSQRVDPCGCDACRPAAQIVQRPHAKGVLGVAVPEKKSSVVVSF